MVESKLTSQSSRENYEDEAIKVGLSTDPADWAVADQAMMEYYDFLERRRPEHIFHCDSPHAAQVLYKELTGKEEYITTHGYGFGQAEAFWVMTYRYNVEIKNQECSEKAKQVLSIFDRLSRSSGFHYMFDEAVFICDKPCKISLDENYEVHCADGPAIEYRDGYKLYVLHGHKVPAKLVETPELITIEDIDTETNAEVARLMMETYGIQKYFADSGARVLDIDAGLNVEGSAIRTLIIDNRNQKWLVGSDGSTSRIYHMPVPNEVTTCVEAHNSIAGFDESNLIAEA